MDEKSLVSKLICERREREEWTQQDLGRRIGVARNTINRWENGLNGPKPPMRRKLALVLGESRAITSGQSATGPRRPARARPVQLTGRK
jgi:transcriptional regulator with XRE-family HTH domain